jgi:hypothetical protein
MRCVGTALVAMVLASPAAADECTILWWDLILPQSEVEFEQTSEVSARLTLKNTGQLKPVSFELALTNVTRETGEKADIFLAKQTLVSEGMSNLVTVTLQPKRTSWIVGFESDQTLRAKDGQTFGHVTMLTGWLICDEIKPLP